MNEALGRLRRRRPTAALTEVEENSEVLAQIIPFPNASVPIDPETSMAQAEIRVLLERAIDDLPEVFSTILVARLIEGMSIEETAELFGILPETVKTRLHRGRRAAEAGDGEISRPDAGPGFPLRWASLQPTDRCGSRAPLISLNCREPSRRSRIQWSAQRPNTGPQRGGNRMLVRSLATLGLLVMGCSEAHAQSAKPNDAQIAHIAYTAGVIDIKSAQLALEKSKNKDVRAFAEDMERDHKAVNDQALALVKKLKVTPQDNDTSKALTKQAADKEAALNALNGAAFDKAYADNEVAYHKTVDGALQSTLIPSASNAELKDLLTTGLKIFEGHEQHAEHLAQSLK